MRVHYNNICLTPKLAGPRTRKHVNLKSHLVLNETTSLVATKAVLAHARGGVYRTPLLPLSHCRLTSFT